MGLRFIITRSEFACFYSYSRILLRCTYRLAINGLCVVLQLQLATRPVWRPAFVVQLKTSSVIIILSYFPSGQRLYRITARCGNYDKAAIMQRVDNKSTKCKNAANRLPPRSLFMICGARINADYLVPVSEFLPFARAHTAAGNKVTLS